MARIFISYRRGDTGGYAGRLCDRLTARFGGDQVFMDIQDIHPGQNFVTSIEDTIATCDCVIVVIGPQWLETVQKRVQSGDDFVRHEVSSALKRQITVIPVLVGRASMPSAADLPAELAELSLRNAVEIRDERFDDDVAALEKSLATELHLAEPRDVGSSPRFASRWLVAIGLLLIAGATGGYFLFRPASRVAGDAATAVAVAAPTVPAIDGEWVAEMQKPGQQPFRIRLSFRRVGDSIGGMVRYPTGDGPMHDVTLKGRALTFYTTHVPQFESSPATIRFQAEVGADSIRLMATDDAGISTGVAKRPAFRGSPSPPAHPASTGSPPPQSGGFGAITIANLKTRRIEVYAQNSSGAGTYAEGYAGIITPRTSTLQVPTGTYKLKLANLFVENVAVTSAGSADVVLGTISLPNLTRPAEVYDQSSSGAGAYAAGYAGTLSPNQTMLEVPSGTYKLKFANLFLERVAVAPSRSSEILLGTISLPGLTRMAEVYDQGSTGAGAYADGFAGRMSPTATTLQVPAGTYKLKLANLFVQQIRVESGKTVVAQ
jgi:hypothetical protein